MNSREKRCKFCSAVLPPDRHGSAKYCDEACYYAAKKIRSNDRYRELADSYYEKKKNETILAQFYPMFKNKVIITSEMLDSLGFNWGYCESEVEDPNNNIWKKCGLYNYLLKNDKTISIWKA